MQGLSCGSQRGRTESVGRMNGDAMDETWKPVVGYERLYEVSDMGRVRSLDRTVVAKDGSVRHLRGKVLAQKFQSKYMRIGLCKSGEMKTWCVHRLVADAFHGTGRDHGHVVRHLNGNPRDNRAANLRWGTWAENSADMVRHGRSRKPSACPHGHEYTPENTRINSRGARECRTCDRAWTARKNAKRRERSIAARPSRPCRVCGTPFKGIPARLVCSAECKKATRRVAFRRAA